MRKLDTQVHLTAGDASKGSKLAPCWFYLAAKARDIKTTNKRASLRTFRSLRIGQVGIENSVKVVFKTVSFRGDLQSSQQRLTGWLGSTESEEQDLLRTKEHFAAHEALFPEWVHLEPIAQQGDGSVIVRSPDENEDRIDTICEQRRRPGMARGRHTLPLLGFAMVGLDKGIGPVAQLRPGVMDEALPHFDLPEVVEGLDLILDSVFTRRGKDGDDVQCQAKEGHGAKAVGVVVWAMKAEVVVELGIGRQAMSLPVHLEALLGDLGGDCGMLETPAKIALQGDGIEGLDFADAFDDETLNHIEGVQFSPFSRDPGQMPAGRWGRSAHSVGLVHQSVSFKNVGDGGAAWQRHFLVGFRVQSAQDGHRTVFTQRVAFPESMAQGQNAGDHLWIKAMGWMAGFKRLILKIGSIEAFPPGAGNPILHVGKTESELAGNFPQSHSLACQKDNLSAVFRRYFFMLAKVADWGIAVIVVPAPLRSAYTTMTANLSFSTPENHSADLEVLRLA